MECHMAHFLHASRTIALLSVPPGFPTEMLCFAALLENFPSELHRPRVLHYQSPGCIRLQKPLPMNSMWHSYPSSLTCDNPAVCWYLVSVCTSKFSPSVHIGLYQAFGWVFPKIFYIFQSLISNFLPYFFIILLLISYLTLLPTSVRNCVNIFLFIFLVLCYEHFLYSSLNLHSCPYDVNPIIILTCWRENLKFREVW